VNRFSLEHSFCLKMPSSTEKFDELFGNSIPHVDKQFLELMYNNLGFFLFVTFMLIDYLRVHTGFHFKLDIVVHLELTS
jgi:hypothetical protein